jgi:hypothetical protein
LVLEKEAEVRVCWVVCTQTHAQTPAEDKVKGPDACGNTRRKQDEHTHTKHA